MALKKIVAIHFKSSLSRGGAERQLLTLYRYNNREKQDLKILYLNENRNNTYLDEYKVDEADLIKISNKNLFMRSWKICKVLNKLKPDILFCWGNYEFILSLPYAILNKNVNIVNGSIRHGVVSLKIGHIVRFIVLQLSRNIVANSKAGLRANRIKKGFILYNGVDKKFDAKMKEGNKAFARKKVVPYLKNEILLISVANFVPYKDYSTVLQSLKQVLDMGFNFYYIILGDGPLRQSIEREIDQLWLSKNVRILGRVNNVQDYLNISDIMIHSSKGEGCSNSIIEAMFSSLPIVASRVGGIPEYVDDDNGVLFEYKNGKQLTNALVKLLSDRDLMERMGRVSYQRAKQYFTAQKMLDKYYEIIERITA
jgi:glycosyltransferase involved in cell wall biosynthesis